MIERTVQVILSLGANLGNAQGTIQMAYELIADRIGDVLQFSSFYESEPWGFESEHNFINSVIIIETSQSPFEVLAACQKIEKDLGRLPKKSQNYESRFIDIDIIDYNHEILRTENLQLPHKFMHKRSFVLVPLLELDENWKHPVLLESGVSLLDQIIPPQILNKIK